MKISVIVPVYNSDKYIERCIRSIIFQTFKDWELILINDGSTDKSGIICELYANLDKRIKVIHKSNSGVSLTRNIGIEKAKGEYITFVDSDDWIEPDFFGKVINEIKQMNVPILITGYLKDNNNVAINMFKGKCKKIISVDEARKEFFLCDKFSWAVYAKFYKKEILNKIKFDISLKIGEDMLFFWQVLNSVEKIGYLPLYKYHYDISASKTMTSKFSLKWFDGIKVKKFIYNEVKANYKELEILAKILYMVEMVILAKKAIKIDRYITKILVKYLQKKIRNNIYLVLLYPNSNIITFRQRLGMIFFLLPYNICKLLKNIN